MESLGQGTLQDMGPNRAATTKSQHPPAARASQQICCPKDLFLSSPEGLFQEHTPVNGLELCTLPDQLKQPFTYTPSAAAYL